MDPKGKDDGAKLSAGTFAAHAGLARAFALDPEQMEAAVARGLQPLSRFPAGCGPTTEPALAFKARG